MLLKNKIKDVLLLFFPKQCVLCENSLLNNEKTLCIHCLHDLPFANYSKEKNNPVEKTFFGRIPVEAATALFLFKKENKGQKLIHQLKYKQQKKIGEILGELLGNELKNNRRFATIDFIIAVPLHPKKLKKRGYNQLSLFGKKLSEHMEVPMVETILQKREIGATQTKKIRLDRWENAKASFYISDLETLKDKHVLLIDDVITTGATLEACCKTLLQTKNLKISIATIAFAEIIR